MVIEMEKAIVQFGGAVKVFSSLLSYGFDAAESEKDGILKQVFQCSGSIPSVEAGKVSKLWVQTIKI